MELQSIKQLIQAGDFPRARDLLRDSLTRSPNDEVAQMLYGTCCQIMGDAETFGRIYQRLAPEMERCVKRGEKSERTRMWLKYAAMFAMLLMCGTQIWAQNDYYATFDDDDDQPIAMSTNGENDEFERVMKMPLKEKFRHFLQIKDVKEQLHKGRLRAVVIPLQSPKEYKEQENLLLIRTKGDLQSGADVVDAFKMSAEVLREGPEVILREIEKIRAIKKNKMGEDINGTNRISQLRKERRDRMLTTLTQRETELLEKIRALGLCIEVESAKENADVELSSFVVNSPFVEFSPFERNAWIGEKTAKTGGVWEFNEFEKAGWGGDKAMQCIGEYGALSDLIISEDSGSCILGICFVNVHGKMGGRAKYAGPRDYGDRFPRRVVTPQGKVIYELTEEMIRKEMEKKKKQWNEQWNEISEDFL